VQVIILQLYLTVTALVSIFCVLIILGGDLKSMTTFIHNQN